MTKVLSVDDSEQNLYLLKVLLEGHGYQATSASNGDEALKLARKEPPDIIVSDILMPVMDGFSLCREWQKDESLKNIPFVFYTDPKDEAFALSLGAARFIVKPAEPDAFVVMVREVIGEAEQGHLAAPREHVEPEPVYLKQYNERLIKKLEDKMLNLERANQRLSTLFHASAGMIRISPLDELVGDSMRTFVEALGYANASYFGFDEEKQELRFQQAVGFSEEIVAAFRRELVFKLGEERGLVGLVGHTRELLVIDDTRDDPRWITVDKNILSGLFLPIVYESSLVGVVNFLSTKVSAFDEQDARNAMTLANNMAIAIENSRLFGEIKRSERRFRTILEGSADAIVSVDPEGVITDWSDGAEQIFGFASEEVIGQPLESLIPENQLQSFSEAMQIMGQQGYVRGWEAQQDTKDGRLVDLEITLTDLGANLGFTAILRDITNRNKAKRALQESEASLSEAQRIAHLGNWDWDIVSNELSWSDEIYNIFGLRPQEFKATYDAFLETIHPDDRDFVTNAVNEALEGKPYHIDHRVVLPDETERFVHEQAEVTYDEDGQPIRMIGIVQDITDSKESEIEIARMAAVIDQASESVMITDLDGHITYVNPFFEGATGYTAEEAIGQNPSLLRSGKQDQVFYKTLWEKITSGEAWSGVLVNKRKDGSIFHESATIFPVRDVSGTVINYAAVKHDVTNMVEAEEKIQRQLGRITALYEIDQSITGVIDLNLTLNKIVDEIITQLDADAASVLLYDTSLQILDFIVSKGYKNKPKLGKSVWLGTCFAGQAVMEKRIIHISEIEDKVRCTACADQFAAEEFSSYYVIPLISKAEVVGVIEVFHRSEFSADDEWLEFLGMLAQQTAIAIDNSNLFENLNRANINLHSAYDQTLEGWANALELRDNETEGHSRRVTEMTLELARMMNISQEQLVHIRRGTLLHDIGKMGIPDEILHKPGPLNDGEWKIMRQHHIFAYNLISPIAYLKPALDIPYSHHEKWDGSGYPRGLKGKQIPLAARIFAVVDVWDALRSDRPYRDAWSEKKVWRYLQEQSGKHFDPQVVKTFLEMIEND